MQCSKIENLMSDIVDGTLPPEMEAEVTAHLAECAACTRSLADLRAILAETTLLEAPELPDGFAERLRARAAERVPASRRSQVLHRLVPAFGAAVMIFMAVAAWQSATWRGAPRDKRAVAPMTARSDQPRGPAPQQKWPLESSGTRDGTLTAREKPMDAVTRLSPSGATAPVAAGSTPAAPIDQEVTAKARTVWDQATPTAPAAYREAPPVPASQTAAGGGGAGAPPAAYPNRWGDAPQTLDATQPIKARTDMAPQGPATVSASPARLTPGLLGRGGLTVPPEVRLRTMRVGDRPGVAVVAPATQPLGDRSRSATPRAAVAESGLSVSPEIAREAAPATGLKRVSVSVPTASGPQGYTLFISAAFGRASDENRKVGLHVADVSLESVLTAIANQNVGFAVLAPNPFTDKVSAKMNDAPPNDAFAMIFTVSGYRWFRDGQAWTLERKEDTGGK